MYFFPQLIAGPIVRYQDVNNEIDNRNVTFEMFAISYMLQIYFDFSGYSDIAIGLGKMLGFNFPENFNYPYMAKSITDFWRR